MDRSNTWQLTLVLAEPERPVIILAKPAARRACGWIVLREAAHLLSVKQPEYAFGEMDEEGSRHLAEFAARYKYDIQFMLMERIHFIRKE